MTVSCGAAVALMLERFGVRHVFGIPGNHTLELYRGLAASAIEHVTTRHEQGAAFMADGYARASGQPGVAMLISGPGLLNAATGIAQALSDSVPLLVITAVASSEEMGKGLGLLHDLPDQSSLAAGFCRRSFTVSDPEALEGTLTRAWCEMLHGRPGPVHVQIPLDVMVMPWSGTHPQAPLRKPAQIDVAPLLEALAGCREPVLLIGGGSVDVEGMADLAERLDAPVVNTVAAKGVVSRDHPLAVGGSPSLPTIQRALARADVVLALGTELGETDYALLPADGPGASWRGTLARVDIDERQLHRNRAADVAVAGDVQSVVRALLDELEPEDRRGVERARELRAAVRAEHHYHEDLRTFFDALHAAHSDLVVVGDSTRPTYYAAWMFETAAPRRYFHSVSGFGTLGYALPAAFGAKLSTSAPVVALIGDGGLQFTLPELATGAQRGVGVPVIVWCNTGYEEISHSLSAAGVGEESAQVSTPDLQTLAAAYELPFAAPSSAAELTACLERALAADRPSIIRVEQSDFVTSASGAWYA